MYTPPELVYNIVEYTSFACVYFSMAVPYGGMALLPIQLAGLVFALGVRNPIPF